MSRIAAPEFSIRVSTNTETLTVLRRDEGLLTFKLAVSDDSTKLETFTIGDEPQLLTNDEVIDAVLPSYEGHPSSQAGLITITQSVTSN